MNDTNFHPFQVEQFLSETEHGVAFNFSESGVHPLTLAELVTLAEIDADALLQTLLDYPQVNGFTALRATIAALYPGADADQILVTVGATEANTLVANTLLEPGDNMVCFRPTYEQLSGNALNRGVAVRWVDLRADDGWVVDAGALDGAVDDATKLIHVVNPNNPTGQILSAADRRLIIDAAARVGAWIVADEVYIGTERETATASTTESFWGSYDKVLVINSMSKAYGLPGLRLGWLVGPAALLQAAWRRHEYASIAAGTLSMRLAQHALTEPARAKLVARARRLISRGFETFRQALARHPGVFSVTPPRASAMSFVRYRLPIASEDFARRLRAEHDVLVIPGARFGVEHHFRFSSALPDDYLRQGLARLDCFVNAIQAETV